MFKFIKSSTQKSDWYQHNNYEIAFWGRSNVGKSSLINALVGNKKMARVSKTPGRTQLLNFFENENKAVFVDLPGYGYARLSKTKIQTMMHMVEEYLINRENLKAVYLLIDSRHGISANDKNVIEFLCKINLMFIPVYTKADKLNQKEKNQLLKRIKAERQQFQFDNYYIVSAETHFGVNELAESVSNILEV
ncbi:GTP-binding protein [Mycoplasmopsis mustelae]|uniref:Probable GTP-binding protein EngB n=1 Tax=Mycoplasmopsis mustelae TaxID=171289 RepID=A0A4R7UDN5_9BACT|nr:ribosome biogenesis GTP-binding protein YihA/YsxC [Mycoplasmopsis mustelae]TDV24166.1 GTP-binding protein [Mycoplasmopsis mustelae]